MKYLCLAYGDEEHMKALTKAEFDALAATCKVHDEELRRTGKVVMTESLEWGPPRSARVARLGGALPRDRRPAPPS